MPITNLAARLRTLYQRLQSLRVVIAATVVLGVVLATTVSYLDQVSGLRQRHIEQTQAALDRLGHLTALALREPLWQFEVGQANSILEAALTEPDVVSMSVVDNMQHAFAAQQRPTQDQHLVLEGSYAIQRGGQKVGTLHIRMSTAGYLRTQDSVRQQSVRMAALVSVGALLVIVLLMHWRLVRPLERLVRASHRIEKGQLDVPIRRVFTDEVGTLADSLEVTRQSLIHLIDQLERRNLALTDANEHLEHRVAERTQSLEVALQTLERAQKEMMESEKLASLGRVVAGVAHELNTPIGNALLGVSTLESDLRSLQAEMASGSMRRSSLGSFVERAQEGLGLSHNNLARAAHLIADFKQVSVDQTSDQRRCFDLAEVSAEVLNMLQPTLRKTAFQIVRDLPAGLACDSFPGGYGQVLTNLVLNAVNHAFEPGAPGNIGVRIGPVGDDQVEMVVSDDGLGMDESVRGRIFDPFFTTKMGRGGTGLGMNIVHGIVTRVLKGHVSVTSMPGQGTQIRVVMPRVVDGAEGGCATIP